MVRREIYNLKIKSFVWPCLLASDSGNQRPSAPEKEKPLLSRAVSSALMTLMGAQRRCGWAWGFFHLLVTHESGTLRPPVWSSFGRDG